MRFFFETKLTQKWNRKLSGLLSACAASGDIFDPLGTDGDGFWLAADEKTGSLAGCLILFQTGEASWECIPLTDPGCRKKGVFSALLSEACKAGNCPGEEELWFTCRPGQKTWAAVLEAIQAEKVYDEYKMELSLEGFMFPRTAPSFPVTLFLPDGKRNHGAAAVSSDQPQLSPESASFQDTGRAVAPHVSCFLSPQRGRVYLSHLVTEEPYRNQGLGAAFLTGLFFRLAALGFTAVSLQVSGENEPALALYKKTGFRITETLSFYLY